MNNRILKRLAAMFFAVCVVVSVYILRTQASAESVFYLSSTEEYTERSLPEVSDFSVESEYYNKFLAPNAGESTVECPRLDIYIKYIKSDADSVDGAGKCRYVYSLDAFKENPQVGMELSHSGWTDRALVYVLYHGAVYYGETCRDWRYSMGNWQMDYFVTQMAIYILNNQFTLQSLWNAFAGNPGISQTQRDSIFASIEMLVEDAQNPELYDGFSSDGWVDLSQGKFALRGYSKEWSYRYTYYDSKKAFQAQLESCDEYDFKEHILKYTIDVPEGVEIVRFDEKMYGDFKLKIQHEQFSKWQATGWTVPIQVEASLMKYWGGKVFSSLSGADVQAVCMFAGREDGGETTFTATVEIPIPQAVFLRTLTIQKKILASEVNWEHGNPIFFFTISGENGMGVPEVYQTFVEFTKDAVSGQKGPYYVMETKIENLSSGIYDIQECEVARYLLTDVEGLTENVKVEKDESKIVNGVTKIDAEVQIDVTFEDAKVCFSGQKVRHHKFSDNAVLRNHFVVPR